MLGSCSLVLRCVAFVGGVQARGDDHKGERVGGGQSAPLLDDDGHHHHHHYHHHYHHNEGKRKEKTHQFAALMNV